MAKARYRMAIKTTNVSRNLQIRSPERQIRVKIKEFDDDGQCVRITYEWRKA